MTATQRIDKWLWYARFFKSRSLAARICEARKVRLNGSVVTKPSHLVKEDDVLTFAQRRGIRVVRIADAGSRRGPAAEAAMLYEDLAPPEAPKAKAESRIIRESGAGVPPRPNGGRRTAYAAAAASDPHPQHAARPPLLRGLMAPKGCVRATP